MATNYPGDKTAAEAPSPAPGNNLVPIVVLPDDGDDLNAASVAQAYKTLADFSAWNASNDRMVISAIASNATPLAQFKDSAGNVRSVVDNNGYYAGPTLEISESWMAKDISVDGPASAVVMSDTLFKYSLTGTATTSIVLAGAENSDFALTTAYPASKIHTRIKSSGLSGSHATIATLNKVLMPTAVVSAVGYFDGGVSNISVNHTITSFGFSTSLATDIATEDQAIFYFKPDGTTPAGGANWIARTGDGTTDSDTDTAIPVVANQMYRMRIEIHGASSSYGAVAKFYINGSLVATKSSNLPRVTSSVSFVAGQILTANATVETVQFIGPVKIKINSMLSGLY